MKKMKQNLKKTGRNTLFFFSVLLHTGFTLRAQLFTYANNFLEIGVGAREMALGKSNTAAFYNANAVFWNPAAALSKPLSFSAELSHANYFNSLASYDTFSFLYSFNEVQNMGFAFVRFAVDDIPNTLNLLNDDGVFDFNNLTSFAASDNAFLWTYAQNISKIKGLRLSVGLHFIFRKQAQFAQGYGMGSSIALYYATEKWQWGANLRHATTSFNIWINHPETLQQVFQQTQNEIPNSQIEYTAPQLNWGVARQLRLKQKNRIILLMSFPTRFDRQQDYLISSPFFNMDCNTGVEWAYNQFVFARVGVNEIQQIQTLDNHTIWTASPHAGAGIKYKNWALDYAATHLGQPNVIPTSHFVSVSYSR